MGDVSALLFLYTSHCHGRPSNQGWFTYIVKVKEDVRTAGGGENQGWFFPAFAVSVPPALGSAIGAFRGDRDTVGRTRMPRSGWAADRHAMFPRSSQ